MIDRYTVGDRFAVIYSPYYANGWYTTHGNVDLLFSPFICNIIDKYGVDNTLDPTYSDNCEYGIELIEEFIDKSYNGPDDPMPFLVEVGPLAIKWIPNGSRFAVIEVNGIETVLVENDICWFD